MLSPMQITLNFYTGMGPVAGMLNATPQAQEPEPKPKPKSKKKKIREEIAHPNPSTKSQMGNKTLRELINSGV
jgi:hypothetical protein